MQQLPDTARKGVEITEDIRDLALTVGTETGVWAGGLVTNLLHGMGDGFERLSGTLVTMQLPDWWPDSNAEAALPASAQPTVAGSFYSAKKALYGSI